MAASSPESLVSPGVGPHASIVSMPPEALPPELWQLIIATLDDHCFVWFVLRRASPYLRAVTEDVFARHMLRTCSLRFAGQHAKNLLPHDMQESVDGTYRHAHHTARRPLPPPTFRFQPCAFVPADTKTRVILTIANPASDPASPSAHQGPPPILSNERLAAIFFNPESEADPKRTRLINEAHFVRFNSQLKSIRIPSLVIDVPARHITLDWRQLCQDFLCDELKCRMISKSLGSWSMKLTAE